jgi:hypothetical protein
VSEDEGKKKGSYGVKRWEKTKRALLAYKNKEGNLRVPDDFTIPKDDALWEPDLWGMPLGTTVKCIRNNNTYSKYRLELEEMGFDFDPQMKLYGWDVVKRALLAYKNKEKDLLVPYDFTVPKDDASWEPDLWGVKLGYTVKCIRNKNGYSKFRLELEEMGFDFDPQMKRYGWDLINRALQVYKSKEGNLRVPNDFTIPKDDASWEPDLWGVKLGNTVITIRNKNAYSKFKQELEEMGFDFEHQLYGWDLTSRALLAYKNKEGNLRVPHDFTVPKDDASWEQDLWDMKLGKTVDAIRNNNGYSKYKQKLEEMGFDFEWRNWDLVKRALKAYQSKTGDLLVPLRFIIPAGDASWEQDLWGMKLGKTVNGIRNKNYYSGYRQELEEMGFDYVSQHLRRWERLKKALLAYESEYDDLLVPRGFVVPSNPSWELDLWDMNLGASVYNIRNSNGYKAHRQELKEMGFY